jgi:ribosomal protein S12 methylthiotransferase accessory factor
MYTLDNQRSASNPTLLGTASRRNVVCTRKRIKKAAERVCDHFRKILSQDCPVPRHAELENKLALSWAEKWGKAYRVTRLAKATGLDRLGIPNYYVVRPEASNPCCIISSGKGLTDCQAMVSAYFECFERWSAEDYGGEVFIATAEDLRSEFKNWPLASPPTMNSHESHHWIVGFDLARKAPCFMPLRKAVFPRPRDLPPHSLLRSDTNGLAAATRPLEAIVTALLEVFERDTISRVPANHRERLAPESLPEPCAELCSVFSRQGVDISLFKVRSIMRVPVHYALSRDDEYGLSFFFCSGSACHWCADHSLSSAVLEASQSRVAFISGLRDDVAPRISRLLQIPYCERRKQLARLFDSPTVPFIMTSPEFQENSILKILDSLISNLLISMPDAVVSCIPLRSWGPLCCYRVFVPQLMGVWDDM